jgi:hypothetical protein
VRNATEVSRFNTAVTPPTVTVAPMNKEIPFGEVCAKRCPAAANKPSSLATKPTRSWPETSTNGGQTWAAAERAADGWSRVTTKSAAKPTTARTQVSRLPDVRSVTVDTLRASREDRSQPTAWSEWDPARVRLWASAAYRSSAASGLCGRKATELSDSYVGHCDLTTTFGLQPRIFIHLAQARARGASTLDSENLQPLSVSSTARMLAAGVKA